MQNMEHLRNEVLTLIGIIKVPEYKVIQSAILPTWTSNKESTPGELLSPSMIKPQQEKDESDFGKQLLVPKNTEFKEITEGKR